MDEIGKFGEWRLPDEAKSPMLQTQHGFKRIRVIAFLTEVYILIMSDIFYISNIKK
jgi:hypothetical protein